MCGAGFAYIDTESGWIMEHFFPIAITFLIPSSVRVLGLEPPVRQPDIDDTHQHLRGLRVGIVNHEIADSPINYVGFVVHDINPLY